MKNILVLPALFLFCMFSQTISAQQHTISDLAGRWEAADGTSGTMEFIEGSKVVVSVSGMQIPTASYTVDFSQDPIWFDVFISPGKAVKSLLKFVDDNTIKWQVFIDGDRPLDFTDNNTVAPIILKRQK